MYLCEEVVVERGPEAADVQLTRRARGESHSHLLSLELGQMLIFWIRDSNDSPPRCLFLTSFVFAAVKVLFMLQNLRLQFLMNKTPGLRVRSIRTIASRGRVPKWDFEMAISQASIPKNERTRLNIFLNLKGSTPQYSMHIK